MVHPGKHRKVRKYHNFDATGLLLFGGVIR